MRIRKFICVTVLAAFTSVGLNGCYGSNALFNKVHQWNGAIDNKWINSAVHFVFWVVQVYEISLLVDLIILNTIEFWMGSNPLAMGDTYEEIDSNGNKIYAVKNADGTLTVNITDANGKTADFTLELNGDVIGAVDAGGAVIAMRTIKTGNAVLAQK